MGDKSPIEWTDATWNPLAAFDRETGKRGWFCTKVSDGCTNCYAEVLNKRLGTGHLYRAGNLEKVEFRLVNLDQPMRWQRPRRVFVNSMTDLFHEAVPDGMIDQVFVAMYFAPQHVFQILTKRPERMAGWANATDRKDRLDEALLQATTTYGVGKPTFRQRHYPPHEDETWPLPNVWLGTSVESQAAADERIPHLLAAPAALRFLSCEPLLAPIDLVSNGLGVPSPDGFVATPNGPIHLEDGAPLIDWVIVGGESGTRARPFGITWARSIVRDCQAAGIPVFVKQLGSNPSSLPTDIARDGRTLRHSKGGDWNEWPEYLRVREFPELTHG